MRVLILLASLALAACANRGPASPTPGETAPTVLPMLCPPSIQAPSIAEPLPPETGLAADVLFDMVSGAVGEEKAKAWWRWFTTDYPAWGRAGWTRVDQARAAPPCVR